MANILYGAKSDNAREHYLNALNIENNQIGILYEIAYGFFLLDSKNDLIMSKELLSKAINIEPKNYLDILYIKKINILLNEL